MAALNALFMSIALLVMSSLTSSAEIKTLKYSAGVSSTGSLMMTDSNGTSSPSHLMRRFPPHGGTSADAPEPDGLLDMQSNRSQTPAEAWVDIGCVANGGTYTGAWVDKTATQHNGNNIAVQCCRKSNTQCTFSTTGSATSGNGCVNNTIETGITGTGNKYLTCTRDSTGVLLNSVSSQCLGTGKTFAEARTLCNNIGSGWDLCSHTRMTVFKKEDNKELCCNSGCNYDNKPVWVKAM
eukprot:gnl/MRDRNA2_/MRDRNA2_128651_c0_seq1.p1 gnl/MRDRNA2_/MRDRNA2_128651_c0~~gnl/MRDRNA2_/MRDRNA2_128651_c0_seq1.p1  ORF type:complete len:265 (+),score=35.29 gnl/MRDRNA2_/MRDRNA2_128651_c0_seq1:82-795(+)